MAEQFVIALIVLAAAAYTGRRLWKAVAAARAPKGGGCDSGCGCEDCVQHPAALGVRVNSGGATDSRVSTDIGLTDIGVRVKTANDSDPNPSLTVGPPTLGSESILTLTSRRGRLQVLHAKELPRVRAGWGQSQNHK